MSSNLVNSKNKDINYRGKSNIKTQGVLNQPVMQDTPWG